MSAALTTRAIAALRRSSDRRPAATAAGLYAVGLAVALLGALDGRGVLTATTTLYDLLPWSAFAPHGVARNHLLTDPAVDFSPWMTFARAHLRAGDLPGWNPYALAGTPFYANPQTALLSPFNVPHWILPAWLAGGVSALLKLWVAAFGTFLLARALALRFLPCLLAGVAFAGCAYLTVWLSHPHVNVAVALPWVLLATERTLRRGRAADVLLLATAVAVVLLGGHPGTQVHTGLALVLWVACRLAQGVAPRRRRGVALVLAGALVGALVAAAAWMPGTLLAPGTTGLEARTGATARLGLSTLTTLVAPDWWGDPSGIDFGGPLNYNERTVYAGAVALLLALAALTTRSGLRRGAPAALLVAVGLGAAYGVPPLGWLNTHLPPLSYVGGGRIVLLAQLGIALLAAVGLQELLDRPAARPRAAAVAAAALAAAVVAGLLVSLRGPGATGPRDMLAGLWHRVSSLQVARGEALLVFALLAAALLATIVALAPRRLRAPVAGILVLALAVADASVFVHGYQPIVARDVAFPGPTPALRRLIAHQGSGRMVTISGRLTLLPDSAMTYGLREVLGHDPPEPGAAYSGLLQAAGADAFGLRAFSADPAPLRVLDALAVSQVLTDPDALPAMPRGWSRTYAGPDGDVYANARARPRASVPRRVLVTPDREATLARIRSTGFVAQRDATVTRPDVPAARGSVRIVADGDDAVVMRADLRTRGLVLLADRMAPGWTVSVDGRHAGPVVVDGALRGVVVDAGTHAVRWSYRVPGLTAALVASALGLLGLLCLAGPALRRR